MTLGLVMIDLDETLLKGDKTYDEERFDRIVHQLDEQGIIVCIATGNSYWKLEEYINKHTQEIVYLAGENGNFITQKGEILEINTFPIERIQEIKEVGALHDNIEVVVCTGFNQYTKGFREKNAQAVLDFYEKHERVDTFDSLPDGNDPVKLAIYSPNDLNENKEAINKVTEHFSDITGVTSGLSWMDFYHIDGGKGYAAKYLQEKYNVSEDNTIAFGDSLNDASMMEHSKYSIAVENADSELKAMCNYVVGTNEDEAVIDVLEQYLEVGNLDFLEEYAK